MPQCVFTNAMRFPQHCSGSDIVAHSLTDRPQHCSGSDIMAHSLIARRWSERRYVRVVLSGTTPPYHRKHPAVLVIIEATLLWLTASLIGVSRFKFSVKILGDDDPPDFISQTLHQPRLVNAAVSTTSCIRPQWSVPVAQSIETPPAEGGIDTVWNIHIKLPVVTPIALVPSARPNSWMQIYQV